MSDNEKEFSFEETSPLNEVELEDIDTAVDAIEEAVAAETAGAVKAADAAADSADAALSAVKEAAEDEAEAAAASVEKVSDAVEKSADTVKETVEETVGNVEEAVIAETEAAVDAAKKAASDSEAKTPEASDSSFEDFFSDDEMLSDDELFKDTVAAEDILDLEAPHETVDDIEKAERRKLISSVITILIPAVLTIIILISGYMFLRDLLEYKRAENEYKKLNEFIVEIEGDTDRYAILDPEFSGSVVKVTSPNEKHVSSTVWYPSMVIGFDALRDINPDFTCVLYIPNLDMIYPVVQSEDNTDYLTKTFEGAKNSSGCIFLDMNASASFSDSNSIIYGHNMRNGSMFGSLSKYLMDPELCDDLPYFFLYEEGVVLKYRIFAYYTTPVDSEVYYGFQDAQGYDQYVERALSASVYETEDTFDFSSYPPMVVLSTCYGSGHVYNMVVHGVLEAKIKVD